MLKFYRSIYLLLFLLYFPLLISITFFYPRRERKTLTYEYHLIPLQSTIAQIKDPAQYYTPGYWRMFIISIAGNVLLFVPLGFFLRFYVYRRNSIVFLYAVCLSIIIELAQLVLHAGVCDVDDVILNSAGAFAGIMLCCFLHKNHIIRKANLNQSFSKKD